MASKTTSEKSATAGAQARADTVDATTLIALVPMRSWDVIGDLGCGYGQLALPLARYAYSGKVYALDTHQKDLDRVKERAQQAKLGNIETVLCKDASVPLEDGALDGAVLAAPAGDIARPKALMKEAYRLVKKGGWMALILGPKADGKENGAAPKNQADELGDAAAAAGFKRISSRPINGTRRLLVLRK
jgi:ubiquinone/menaquinone biosynthesis C-methylase UbiE